MTKTLYPFLQTTIDTEKNLAGTAALVVLPGSNFTDDLTLFIESIQIYLLSPGKPLVLWSHPCQQTDITGYLPDMRIQILKLIGKPSAGLSPPGDECWVLVW